jgi:hypothetical protein
MTEAVLKAQGERIIAYREEVRRGQRALDQIWEAVHEMKPQLLSGLDDAPLDPIEQAAAIIKVLRG